MNIIYLCDRYHWQRKIPRTRFDCIDALSQKTKVVKSGIRFDNWNPEISLQDNIDIIMPDCDVLMVYKPEQYWGWEHCTVPLIATQFNDAWEYGSRMRDIRLPNCRLVIMHHQNEVAMWQKKCPDVTFVNIPYGINLRVFRQGPILRNRTIDILLTGAIDDEIYPLRFKFRAMINSNAFGSVKCMYRAHPGYRLTSPKAEAKQYANALRNAKIVLADTSKYGYAAEKYYEIPACGAVICGNIPHERQDIFRKFVIEIDEGWGEHHIARVVQKALRNAEKLQEQADYGAEYTRGNFTCDHYADRCLGALEDWFRTNTQNAVSV